MKIIRCKCCGGILNIQEDQKICECEYCGAKQTYSLCDDEKINNLSERGKELIRNNLFDDAKDKFESILELDKNNPEVYWNLLMCKFGISYQKDPYTGKMIPNMHRTQNYSVTLDEDYKKALELASDEQKEYYLSMAKVIDKLQNKYNQIAKNEKPYDIFICYKQKDENGVDTQDFKIAYDLYNALTNNGYKVFFSYVSLEDKVGEEYEPYIYSALNTSKVLIALGTKKEFFNSAWVKNEWSRYMFMMRNDYSKKLIPLCEESIELPEELTRFQAILMKNNIIWKEDLIRNIIKLFEYKNNIDETNNDFHLKDNIDSDANSLIYKQKYIINDVKPKNKKIPLIIFAIVFVFGITLGIILYISNINKIALESQLAQLQESEKSYQDQISKDQETITDLNSQIEDSIIEDNADNSDIVYFKVISDDAIYFRSGPGSSFNKTTYEESPYAYKDQIYVVLETQTDAEGNVWAKVGENAYFAIKYGSENWAIQIEY